MGRRISAVWNIRLTCPVSSRMETRLSLVGALGLGLLFGCFSDHTAPSTGGDGVTVGDIFFRSDHNGSANPAIDTVQAGTTLTWTWVNTGTTPHSVKSEGSPAFVSSATLTGEGTVYSVTLTTPGLYAYDCAVHGSVMAGSVQVQ